MALHHAQVARLVRFEAHAQVIAGFENCGRVDLRKAAVAAAPQDAIANAAGTGRSRCTYAGNTCYAAIEFPWSSLRGSRLFHESAHCGRPHLIIKIARARDRHIFPQARDLSTRRAHRIREPGGLLLNVVRSGLGLDRWRHRWCGRRRRRGWCNKRCRRSYLKRWHSWVKPWLQGVPFLCITLRLLLLTPLALRELTGAFGIAAFGSGACTAAVFVSGTGSG